MALMGILGVYPAKNTTYNNIKNKKYPYLLKKLNISYPNQVWGTDITYIMMGKGFMYMVAIMD
jgi:putative transposase